MGDSHVAEGASAFVEVDPPLDRQLFGYVDLYVLDVFSAPDWFEQAIGEAEGQDIVNRFLAEEVIDAKDP